MEANGTTDTDPRPALAFAHLDRAESEVAYARRLLADAQVAERAARAQLVALLKRTGGPIAWDDRVFIPIHHPSLPEVTDFRTITFVHASDLLPDPAPGLGPVEREIVAEGREAVGRGAELVTVTEDDGEG